MKVLQVIDSLQAGGAERMAVNLANAMTKDEQFEAHLCVTRTEGPLKTSLAKEVGYVHLQKNRRVDLKASKRLAKYVKENRIDIIHAHSSSFFISYLSKFYGNKANIVWHVHRGSFVDISRPKLLLYQRIINKLDGIITVSEDLLQWSKQHFKTPSFYLPNFVVPARPISNPTILKGEKGSRVVCVANVKPVKGQKVLVRAFSEVLQESPNWTLHLLGNESDQAYVAEIKDFIDKKGLQDNIYFYGSVADASFVIEDCEIGVLSSFNEGLPMALLEYGQAGLAVAATKVGACEDILAQDRGLLMDAGDEVAISEALRVLMKNAEKRQELANNLKHYVHQNYNAINTLVALGEVYDQIR